MSKTMLKFGAGIFGVILFATLAKAQPVIFPEPLSPRIANYDLTVKLDPKTRVLRGLEVLTWHNPSAAAITELQFHLYPNAFRNSQSSFMKEGGEKLVKKVPRDGWGYLEIEKITLATGEDLTSVLQFIHPDDDNAEDKTVARLPLPRPLGPGQTIVVNITFATRLPDPPIARSGAKGDYFFVSQWFPKIGVFEDGKWNCHQYHLHTEFFADFGVYNARLTVPAKWLVGATGVQVSRQDNGDGTATHFYHAEDVHDFAWTASPHFVEFTGRAQDVDIRVLMQKIHARQGPRHLTAAKLAVEYFQNWYGDYPYPNLTVIDPARGAGETGGMEYPTLITAGTIIGMPRGVREVEMVIIHEFGHNFWYHLVASNEFEDSWLDEGINTYSEIQIMHAIYGAKTSMVDFLGIKADDLQARRSSYVISPDRDPIVRYGWQYYDGASYRSMSYSKPALGLITLENFIGADKMRAVMRAYLARWRFRHPRTRDFIAVANEVSGQNLDWFFDQFLFANAVLDYSVDFVSSVKVKPGAGYDFTLAVSGNPPAAPAPPPEATYRTVVKVRRLGAFRFPLEILVEFENGEKVRETWDGQDTWREFRYLKPSKLKKAAVDPDNKIVLDLNWTNNSRTLAEQRRAAGGGNGYFDMIRFMLKPSN